MPFSQMLDIRSVAPKDPPQDLTHGFFDPGKRLRDLAGDGDQPLDVQIYGRPVTFESGTPPTASFQAGIALQAARAREVQGVEALKAQAQHTGQTGVRISQPAAERLKTLQPPINLSELARFGATPLPDDPFGVSLRSHLRRIVRDA